MTRPIGESECRRQGMRASTEPSSPSCRTGGRARQGMVADAEARYVCTLQSDSVLCSLAQGRSRSTHARLDLLRSQSQARPPRRRQPTPVNLQVPGPNAGRCLRRASCPLSCLPNISHEPRAAGHNSQGLVRTVSPSLSFSTFVFQLGRPRLPPAHNSPSPVNPSPRPARGTTCTHRPGCDQYQARNSTATLDTATSPAFISSALTTATINPYTLHIAAISPRIAIAKVFMPSC